MKVLVLDTTHGGEVLSKIYKDRGDDVTCVDVYKVTPKDVMDRVAAYGIVSTDTVPKGEYDLVVMPCHCPDSFLDGCTYEKRIFFSDAVKEFIDDKRFRIEITGVKGKTSTCFILANILEKAGKKVFLHTSRGQGPWVNGDLKIEDKKSIAPVSLLTLPKGPYDVMICEVSLGGSGKADIAAVTNLIEDYGIARNSRKASEAKKAIFTDNINIVPKDEMAFWRRYCKRTMIGYGGRIRVTGTPEFGSPIEIMLDYNGVQKVTLSPGYLSLQYIEAMDLAAEIAHAMDISKKSVIEGLSTFKGVPGRGEIFMVGDVRHVIERNPGISPISVERTLSVLKQMNALDNAYMIVDPVSKKVCDKMKSEDIKKVAEKYGVEMTLTKGDGVRPSVPLGKTTIIEFIKEGFQ
ncbi:MAG: coenzyme F430 synthase [Candidatus Methanomethylophilaceae archaeon]|jgi:UDP-N-acetylmuramyl pentapeptide synthase